MGQFLVVVGLFGLMVFFIKSIISAIKKNGKLKKNLLYTGISFVVLIIGAVNVPTTKNQAATAPAPTQNNQDTPKLDDKAKQEADAAKLKADQEAQAKADAEQKAKEEADAKAKVEAQAKADAEAKAKAEYAIQHPNWNTSDMYVNSNGNLPLAITLMNNTGDLSKSAKSPQPISVQKAPWNYYGTPVKLTGTVGVIQDYPPGNDISTMMGGTASEIVIGNDDGAIVDALLSVSSGNVKVGDDVTIYGYPVGLEEVNNKLGGKTPQLVIVGNKYKSNN